jgi:hypothetical protein
MKKSFMLLFGAALVLFSGCGKRSADIKEWEQFQDTFFRTTFSYPKGWVVAKESNKVVISSSSEVAEKFFDHDPRKPDGVQVIVASERIDSVQDYVKYMDSFKADQEQSGFKTKSYTDATLAGLGAKQIIYSGVYDAETKVTIERVAAFKDSTIYYVQYAAFNDQFEPYKLVFDSVIASIVLPKPKEKVTDPNTYVIPSKETKMIKNDVLDVAVPDNMNETYPKSKGEASFAMNLKIYREDCTIDFDIRPAKKLSLEKVVEQNSKKITNITGKGSATLSGEKAQYVSYSPRKDARSRIYFMVKNNNIYRLIMNYYAPMEKDFLPAFEKIVVSIRLK